MARVKSIPNQGLRRFNIKVERTDVAALASLYRKIQLNDRSNDFKKLLASLGIGEKNNRAVMNFLHSVAQDFTAIEETIEQVEKLMATLDDKESEDG